MILFTEKGQTFIFLTDCRILVKRQLYWRNRKESGWGFIIGYSDLIIWVSRSNSYGLVNFNDIGLIPGRIILCHIPENTTASDVVRQMGDIYVVYCC